MQDHEVSQEFLTTLQFVQNIISRMATMCTICKICAITAFPVLIVAGMKSSMSGVFILTGVLVLVLACMDGLYLFRERNYIGHYRELVEKWDLGTLQKEDMFKVTIGSLKRHPKNTKGCPLFSTSIWPFYAALLISDLAAWYMEF